jgi:hypothetical protein
MCSPIRFTRPGGRKSEELMAASDVFKALKKRGSIGKENHVMKSRNLTWRSRENFRFGVKLLHKCISDLGIALTGFFGTCVEKSN